MKRVLILAAPAVLALGLVACGDDDDDSPDTTETVDTASVDTATDDTATDDTATDGTLLPGGTILPGGTVLPGGSLPDISIPDISIPDISLPEEASEIFESVLSQTFPNLSDEQVSCLAEAFQGELDLSQIQSVAEDCGIDESDLVPGG
jgi:hypothetical protein